MAKGKSWNGRRDRGSRIRLGKVQVGQQSGGKRIDTPKGGPPETCARRGEHRVAEMAREGLSNREIAQALLVN